MPIEIHPMKAKIRDGENNWHYVDGFSNESEEIKASLKLEINQLSTETSEYIDTLTTNAISSIEESYTQANNEITQAKDGIIRYATGVLENLPTGLSLKDYAVEVKKWQFKPLKWTIQERCIKYRYDNTTPPYFAENGTPCPLTGRAVSDYVCTIIQPEDPNGTLAGEQFIINGFSGAWARAWFFLDENDYVIPNTEDYDKEEDGPIIGQGYSTVSEGTVIDQVIFGPPGAKKLILNNRQTRWAQSQTKEAICYQKVNPYDIMDKHEQFISTHKQFIEALQNSYKIDTNSITWLENKTIDLTNGKINTVSASAQEDGYKCSDKIINCDSLIINKYVNESTESRYMYCYVVSYKADNTFLESKILIRNKGATNVIYEVPSEAEYVRICYRTYKDDDVKFEWSGFYRFSFVSSSEQTVEPQTSTIPTYWDNALTEVKNKVLKHDLMIPTGDRFFFVTDPHWKAQTNKMSSKIISELADYLRIYLCLLGGDMVKKNTTTSENGYNEIANYIRSFQNPALRLFATAGNHDLQSPITPPQTYNAMMRQMETFCETTGNLLGAVYDNKSQKVRYIQFQHASASNGENYAIPQSRKDWLTAKCVTELTDAVTKRIDGWTVVVMCHCYWNNGVVPTSSQAWAEFLMELKDEGAPIALWLVGHTHIDQHTVLESSQGNKLLVVCSTTDNVSTGQIGSAGYVRADDTDTEAAFDIVHLDTTNKKVYFTRVGGWFIGPNDTQAVPPKVQPKTGDRAFNYQTGDPIDYETGDSLAQQTEETSQ